MLDLRRFKHVEVLGRSNTLAANPLSALYCMLSAHPIETYYAYPSNIQDEFFLYFFLFFYLYRSNIEYKFHRPIRFLLAGHFFTFILTPS